MWLPIYYITQIPWGFTSPFPYVKSCHTQRFLTFAKRSALLSALHNNICNCKFRTNFMPSYCNWKKKGKHTLHNMNKKNIFNEYIRILENKWLHNCFHILDVILPCVLPFCQTVPHFVVSLSWRWCNYGWHFCCQYAFF